MADTVSATSIRCSSILPRELFSPSNKDSVGTEDSVQGEGLSSSAAIVDSSPCRALRLHRAPGLESTFQHLHRKRVDTINYDNPQSREKSFSLMCASENSILELSPESDAAAMIRGWGDGLGLFDRIIKEEHLHRLILEIAPRKSEQEFVDSRHVQRKMKHVRFVAAQTSDAPAATPDRSK